MRIGKNMAGISNLNDGLFYTGMTFRIAQNVP
jgi:hypothetical protein